MSCDKKHSYYRKNNSYNFLNSRHSFRTETYPYNDQCRPKVLYNCGCTCIRPFDSLKVRILAGHHSQQAVNEHVTSVSFAFPYCQSLFSVCKKIITQHQESGGYQTHRYQPGCGYAFVLKHILAAYTGYTPENSPCNRYDGACYHPVFLCTILFILLWVHKICSPAIYFSF